MPVLLWIVAGGVLMAAIALVGSVTLVLEQRTLDRLLHPIVALAAGTLLGGALFHMLPSATAAMGPRVAPFAWAMAGFAFMFLTEQVLHWHHHRRRTPAAPRPLTYLILVADGLHNFVGGIGVAGAFLIDVRVGIAAWLAAAAHEVPQELGDFGILVHGGWDRKHALLLNLLSASTFLLGGVLTWAASGRIEVAAVVAFAAGNFLYIGATDLVPEVAHHPKLAHNLLHFGLFALGAGLLLALRFVPGLHVG
ncbi:MAG: ZIP family metal transporter [Myxococcota bacterium]